MIDGYPKHQHSYVSGPESQKPGRNQFEHSHADGERGHQHPDCGPAYFQGGIARAKRTKKPNGPQIELVELEEWQRTFRVVFVDHYTSEHLRSAGTTPEHVEGQREDFRRNMATGQVGGLVVERMVREFDMTPLYQIETPE